MDEAYHAGRIGGLSLRHAATIAGVAYLLNPVSFAEFYVMPRFFVADAGQTIANLAAHPRLFAVGVLSYFFSLVGDVVLAWSLYVLLAPVNRVLSLLAAWFQLIYAAVTFAALANLGELYRVVAVPSYAATFDKAALPMQATLLLAGFRSGWGLALILFGFHLVVLGWLIARSSYIPRWLGWLIFMNGWAWVLDSVSVYLFPEAGLGFLKFFETPELMLMVWLLGWGWRVREQGPEKAAAG